MAMQIDRYYDSIADLVPPDLRDKLARSREEISAHIDQELDGFATDLTRFIGQQLNQAEQSLNADLAARRSELTALAQELQRQLGEAQAPAAAAAQRLLAAQAAYEERWRGYGRNLRQVLVTGLQAAGLQIPGLGAVAGLFEDSATVAAPIVPPAPAGNRNTATVATAIASTATVTTTSNQESPLTALAGNRFPALSWAWAVARMADLAYEAPDTVQRQLATWGATCAAIISDPAKDTQGFVAQAAGATFIIFRGTEVDRFADILHDADAREVSPAWLGRSERTVHAGFAAAYSETVRQQVQPYLSTGSSVLCGGHSLGGALAVLAAADALAQGVTVNGVITLGQPRVGKQPFQSWFDGSLHDRHLRFTNDQDPVPRVPPTISMGYRHSGIDLHFDAQGRLVRDPAPILGWAEALLNLSRESLKTALVEAVKDHSARRYVELIGALRAGGDRLLV